MPPGKIASVVTALEMFERPVLRPEKPSAAWSLVRVESPGTEWYRSLFRRVGQPYLWFSRLAHGDSELRAILEDPRVELFVMRVDGEEEGILELDFRESGTCELAFFGVTERFVGTGAGRWLMNRALELAWSKRIRRFWVHTCTLDHPGALAFYLRSGFAAFARQMEIDDDPRVIGLLPRAAAPDVPIVR